MNENVGNETFYKGLRDPLHTVEGLGISSARADEINRNPSGPVLTINAYFIVKELDQEYEIHLRM